MATSKEQLQIVVSAQGIAKTKAQLNSMEKSMGGVTGMSNAMKMAIAGTSAVIGVALFKAISSSIRTHKEFEQAMANVKAISGATAVQFQALEANARSLGASTKFTASQVAELQTEYAKLGFTSSEITKVTKGTLALASAVGADLAESASVAGTTLRGFGLDVSETGRVTDVMAKSFSSSALDMQKFTDSMSYVAPVAKMAGFGIEGTTAILGQLANAGISGSMAGTALRKIFLELSNSSSKLSKRLGGSVTSVEELVPALQQLNEEGVTTAEMKDMVGQRAISAFSILLEGSSDVDKLTESLKNAGGSAQKMADIQLDTLEGKLTIMKSAMQGLGIAIGDGLSPMLQGLTEGFTSLIQSVTGFISIPFSQQLDRNRESAESLFSVLEDGNITSGARKQLIAEVNEKYGDLLQNELTEKSSLNDIKKAHDEVTSSIIRQIAVEQSREEIAEVIRKLKVLKQEEIELAKKSAQAEEVYVDELDKHTKAVADAEEKAKKYNKSHGENTDLLHKSTSAMGMQIEEFDNLHQSTGMQTNASELSGTAMENARFKSERLTNELVNNQIEQGNLTIAMKEVEKQANDLANELTGLGNISVAPSVGGVDGDVGVDEALLAERNAIMQQFREKDFQAQFDAFKKTKEFLKLEGHEQQEVKDFFNDKSIEQLQQAKQKELEFLAQFSQAKQLELLDLQMKADIAEAEALGAQKETLLQIEQDYADRKKELKETESEFTLENMQEIGQAVLSVAGNIYDQEVAIQEKSLRAKRKELKERGLNSQAIEKQLESEKEKLRDVKYKQAVISAFESAITSYASLATIPVVGPALGIVAGAFALKYGLDNAKMIKNAEEGGLLTGKSHAQGGIPIEAEGGEFIIRKRAVNAIGLPFLEELNKEGSFEKGGLISGKRAKKYKKVIESFDIGGVVESVSKYKYGGDVKKYKYQEGGTVSSMLPKPVQAINNQPNINVSVSGNLLSSEYVETELAEHIRTAVRRGVDFELN